jgi:hypothetical protein
LLVYCHFLFLTAGTPVKVRLKKSNALSCSSFMKKNRKIYSVFQLCSAVFMILALMWLTVSTPFVIASQQQQAKQHKMEKADSSPVAGNEEETNNPFGNNTDEKAPNANTFSEEYLHHFHIASHFYTEISQYHKQENSDTYIAFHGELLVPPPNAS